MRMENRNLLIGIVLGFAVGGAVGVFLAPSEGKKTRQQLRSATEQAKGKVTNAASKGREYVETKKSRFFKAWEAGLQAAREKRAELEAEVDAEIQQTAATG